MSITAKNKMIACFDGGLKLAKDRLDLFCFEQNRVAKKIINQNIESWKTAKLKQSLVTCDIISVYNEVVDYLIWYYKKIDSSIHAID